MKLSFVNRIRSKLAMGTEKGRGGVKLPRAYGMFKLHWDNELATFAQVLANQCLLRHDMCRATKKFPNPSQAVGKTRFTTPDWHPAGTKERHYAPGLSSVKVTYAITSVMKNWYQNKAAVTADMINNYPDWELTPDRKDGRFYMDMVYSASTHMGCGISAYTDYGYNDNKSKLVYFAILTICNFSGSPKKGKPVYPQKPDPRTSRCGCPSNAMEDENCLCTYTDEAPTCAAGTNCDEPVILLPIFTVNDAPANMISKRRALRKGYDERTNAIGAELPSAEVEHIDYPQNTSNNEHPIVKVLNGIMNVPNIENRSIKTPRVFNRRALEKSVTSLYHKPGPSALGHVYPRMDHFQSRKTSIFSRGVILGASKSFKDHKKDVTPRKDFTKAKHLVDDYVESTKNYTTFQYRPHVPEDRIIKVISTTTEHVNDVEGHAMIHNYINDTILSKHIENRNHREKSRSSKLMLLLDKLEKEAKHIALKGTKKELFDVKIRKIYDSVLGKSSGLPSHIFDRHVDLENEVNGAIQKLIDHDNDHKTETKDEHKHEAQEKPYDDMSKTMIDDIGHDHRELSLQNNIDEDSDGLKTRRKMKPRLEIPYDTPIERNIDSDYEIQPRGRAKTNFQSDKLNSYRESDTEYKPYKFPEHRQSYKNKIQDHSYENFKTSRFSDDVGFRKDKRLKHTRDYYKNRNVNNIEGLNRNHYRRYQATEDVDDDILGPERRKYYQDRLENIERKLHSTRNHKYRGEDSDHRRRSIRLPSSDDEAPRRPSKSRIEHFDMRERSRFLHGY